MDKKLLLKIFVSLLIIPFYYIVGNNIFLLVLAMSLYLILIGLFKDISISKEINNFYQKKQFYSKEKIYLYSIGAIIVTGVLFLVPLYLLGIISNYFLKLKYLELIFPVVALASSCFGIKNITEEYLEVHGLKKKKKIMNIIFITITIIYLFVISYLSVNIFKFKEYITTILIIISPIISIIISFIYLYFNIFLYKKKYNRNCLKTRDERIINYKDLARNIISKNQKDKIIYILKTSFIYVSLILVFKTFTSSYGYTYEKASTIICSTYIYSYLFLYNIVIIFLHYLNPRINKIKEDIKNKKTETTSLDIVLLYQIILKAALPLTILLIILSEPLWMLIYNSHNYNIFSYSILIIIFIITSLTSIDLVNSVLSKKEIIKYLIVALILKLIITIPMIESFYLMGSELIFGEIISEITVLIFILAISTWKLKEKVNISLTKHFGKTLEIINDNIILILFLILTEIALPIDIDNKLEAIFIILIYIIISFILLLLKYKIMPKYFKNKKNVV